MSYMMLLLTMKMMRFQNKNSAVGLLYSLFSERWKTLEERAYFQAYSILEGEVRGFMGLGLTTVRGGASDEQAVVGATSEDCEIEA